MEKGLEELTFLLLCTFFLRERTCAKKERKKFLVEKNRKAFIGYSKKNDIMVREDKM